MSYDTKGLETASRSNNLRRFALYSTVIFLVLLTTLTALHLAPVGVEEANNFFFSLFVHERTSKTPLTTEAPAYAAPVRIVIPKIKLDGVVLNPETQDTDVLDATLLKGAVRYPGSGDLESERNIFIFGHSSDLPVVHNQAFKIFNRLKELASGDEVIVESESTAYRYTVVSVSATKASDVLVTFANEHRLVLSTCNSFGTKEGRYVVFADFVGSSPLAR